MMETGLLVAAIVCTLVYSVFLVLKDEGSKSLNATLSAGSSRESVQTIVDRLDWSINAEGRLHSKAYMYIVANAISFLVIMCIEGRVAVNKRYITVMCIVFVVLLASHSFKDHHMRKYTHANSDSNIMRLRTKLGLDNRVSELEAVDAKPYPTVKRSEYKPYRYQS